MHRSSKLREMLGLLWFYYVKMLFICNNNNKDDDDNVNCEAKYI